MHFSALNGRAPIFISRAFYDSLLGVFQQVTQMTQWIISFLLFTN